MLKTKDMAAKGPDMGGEFSPQEDRRRKAKKGHQQHSIVDVSLLGEGKKITSYRLGEREVCVSAPEGSYSAYPEGFNLNLLPDLKGIMSSVDHSHLT